jgi:hypothetical protein
VMVGVDERHNDDDAGWHCRHGASDIAWSCKCIHCFIPSSLPVPCTKEPLVLHPSPCRKHAVQRCCLTDPQNVGIIEASDRLHQCQHRFQQLCALHRQHGALVLQLLPLQEGGPSRATHCGDKGHSAGKGCWKRLLTSQK